MSLGARVILKEACINTQILYDYLKTTGHLLLSTAGRWNEEAGNSAHSHDGQRQARWSPARTGMKTKSRLCGCLSPCPSSIYGTWWFWTLCRRVSNPELTVSVFYLVPVFVWTCGGPAHSGVSTPSSLPSTAAFVPQFYIWLLNYLKYILSLRKGPNKVFLNSCSRFFPQKGSVLGLSIRKIVRFKIGWALPKE